MTTLTERLTELDRTVEQAAGRKREAWQVRERDPYPRVREALADLGAYRHDVEVRKRDENPEVETRLSGEFLEKVREAQLVIRPLAVGSAGMVELVDPVPDALAATTERELVAARRARNDFARENAEGLAAEAARAQMERLRESLGGDDPNAFRAALAAGG